MICIPIMAKNTDDAMNKMARADTLADIVEIRLDIMESWNLSTLIKSATKPVLVTYRSKKEGGNGSVGYETRVRYLREAMNAGANYVDVEFSIPLDYRKTLLQNRRSSKIVLSLHLRNNTPPRERLERILKQMAAAGVDIVKIVTWARSWEDNFRVLELIPRAQSMGTEIMAFCMGPLGRISRIASPLMGGYMTFASLEAGEESASGQIPAPDMKRVLEMLSP
ncbi:MAG: type I 3-dehydroquinate dehydratase [Deltaproteobacteria bacterium]|nr:type I 3-dehydroquinate dehydratase [Deltaproteobacteria bacterium]